MSVLHASLAEGRKTEIEAIEADSVDGYYNFLQANNARCEKIRRDMEKTKGKY